MHTRTHIRNYICIKANIYNMYIYTCVHIIYIYIHTRTCMHDHSHYIQYIYIYNIYIYMYISYIYIYTHTRTCMHDDSPRKRNDLASTFRVCAHCTDKHAKKSKMTENQSKWPEIWRLCDDLQTGVCHSCRQTDACLNR